MLGVAIAASLPSTAVHIYTDAKGIVTSYYRTINQSYIHPSSLQLPRNFTETGLLFNHVIKNHNNLTLSHVKAHQEDSSSATKTEHGTGNRIADLIAQGKIPDASSLIGSLTLHETDIASLLTTSSIPPLLTIGPTPDSGTTYLRHPNHTL